MSDLLLGVAVAATLASVGTACTSRPTHEAKRGPSSDAAPGTAPFVCDGERCVQRYPRFPDDGEWTCSDTAGVAVCSGGDAPAGTPLNVADPSWTCGWRSAGSGKPGNRERVCVNFAAEFPHRVARGWRCHYIAAPALARVCERDTTAHVIGGPCDKRNPCLDGLRCVTGRCTAQLPPPSCVIDADCDKGTCRFGSCWSDST